LAYCTLCHAKGLGDPLLGPTLLAQFPCSEASTFPPIGGSGRRGREVLSFVVHTPIVSLLAINVKDYKLEGSDFEDNLQIACALASGLYAIITRNKADFKTAAMAVIEPAELLSQLPPSSAGTTGSPASQS
jgi:hypothetical protein